MAYHKRLCKIMVYTCFTSEEFKEFTRRNGIRHLTSAPYHPATNGLVERAVQTFKMAMKKATTTSDSEISRFLFSYRNTPHTTTGVTPAEFLLHRKPRSLLTMLRPSTAERVCKKQIQQEINHDVHARKRAIAVDDPVFIRNFRNTGKKWIPGIVTEVRGQQIIFCELPDGCIVRRHINNVRIRFSQQHEQNEELDFDDLLQNPPAQGHEEEHPVPQRQPLGRSTRNRRPPDRLMQVFTKEDGV